MEKKKRKKRYCKLVKIKLGDIEKPKYLTWTKKQILLKETIINNYDYNKRPIIISSDNRLVDGNHRYDILLNHYGVEHEIFVRQVFFTKNLYNLFIIIFLPVILPMGIFYITKNYFESLFPHKNISNIY